MMANFQILHGQYHIWDIFGLWMKSKVFFCRKNIRIIEIMENRLTVPKWVLIVRLKIPQTPQNLFSRFGQFAQQFEMLLKKGFIGRP